MRVGIEREEKRKKKMNEMFRKLDRESICKKKMSFQWFHGFCSRGKKSILRMNNLTLCGISDSSDYRILPWVVFIVLFRTFPIANGLIVLVTNLLPYPIFVSTFFPSLN